MAYDTYCAQNSECRNTLECIEEENRPRPLLQLRQPRFQFRQMSEMQFHPLLQKEHSPRGNLGHPFSQALQRPNIVVRHLRPPRPLSQTLAECKQNALVPQLQEENAPMQRLRKPHPISTASQKQNSPLQQERLVRLQQPTAEQGQLLPKQQNPSLKQQQPSLKQPQPLPKQQQRSPDQQELSIKQQQPLPQQLQPSPNQKKPSLKQQQPSPKEQQPSLKQQPSSPKQQVPSVKQQQTLPKKVQPSQNQQPPSSKQQQASLKQQQSSPTPFIPVPPAQAINPERRLLAKNNNDELQTDSSDSGKKSSGSILKTKKKTTPNNERRRLMNAKLRKILMPKNATSVLNELIPLQLGLLTVQQTSSNDPNLQNFCAEITVDDINYKGYGVSKSAARHEVAEQVFRDIILTLMVEQIEADTSSTAESQQEAREKEPLPMVQLASFALHKLFTAWEHAGHKVPLLKKLVTPTQ